MVLLPAAGRAAAENTVGKVCCAWESLEEDQTDSALEKKDYTF
ncbi:hypothetical protein [Phascolarctobacterium faecium]